MDQNDLNKPTFLQKTPPNDQPDSAPTMDVSALANAQGVGLPAEDKTSFSPLTSAEEQSTLPEMEDEELRYFEEDSEEVEEPNETDAVFKPNPAETKPPKRFPPVPPFIGLIHLMVSKQESTALYTLGFLLCVLILIPAVLLTFFIYLSLIFAVIALMVLFTVLAIAIIAGGLAGFAYALIMLFTSDPVIALIEIGLGTMLIGIVLALSGLMYELIAVQLPRLIRYFSRLFVYALRWIKAFLFGAPRTPDVRLPSKEADHE